MCKASKLIIAISSLYFLLACNRNTINTPAANSTGCDSIKSGQLKPNKQDSIRLASCLALSSIDSLNLFPDWFLNKGLVAWYPFGGNANDSSGNKFNGSVNGAVLVTDRLGNPNSAYEFFGKWNNGYTLYNSIDLPYIPQLSNINQVSFSFWKKYPDSLGLGNYIFGIKDVFIFGLGLKSISRDTFQIASNIDQNITSIKHQISNKWNHMVIIIDRNRNPIERIAIYQNGVFDSYLYFNQTIPAFSVTNNISLSNCDAGKKGDLDEFRIYNRVLSQSEITYLASH